MGVNLKQTFQINAKQKHQYRLDFVMDYTSVENWLIEPYTIKTSVRHIFSNHKVLSCHIKFGL